MVKEGACVLLLVGAIAGCAGTHQQIALTNAEKAALTRERDILLRQNQELAAEVRSLRDHAAAKDLQLVRSQAETSACRTEIAVCEARRVESHTAAETTQAQMQQHIDAIASRCEAFRGHAVMEGQLRMLQSIQVAGTPSRVKGVFFDDYYYTFEVRVGGKPVVLSKVRTEQEETMFTRALSTIGEIALAFGLRK